MANSSHDGERDHGYATSPSHSGTSVLSPLITYVESTSQLYYNQVSTDRYETNAGSGEDDTIAQPIELALTPQPMPSSFLFTDPPQDGHLYQDDHAKLYLFSASNKTFASNSSTPQSVLENLSNSINATAEQLESFTETERISNPLLLASDMRKWEETIIIVSQTLARAEQARIEDLQAQLDMDFEFGEKHHAHVKRLVRTYQQKLLAKDMEWKKKLEKKHDCTAKLSELEEKSTSDTEQ